MPFQNARSLIQLKWVIFRIQIFQMRILREQQQEKQLFIQIAVTNDSVRTYLMNAVSFFQDIAKKKQTNER